MKLCVIEDNLALRQAMADALESRGYEVLQAEDATDLQTVLEKHQPDVFIIDIELPGESGFSITERMRKAYPQSFIALVTARGKIEERVRGYDSGADLYLVKPINMQELVAAIQAGSRRLTLSQDKDWGASFVLSLKEMVLDGQGQAGPIAVTPSECRLLKALIEAPEHQMEYWELLELLRKEVTNESRRILEVHIVNLRTKLRRLGVGGQIIRSVRNVGYRLLIEGAITP